MLINVSINGIWSHPLTYVLLLVLGMVCMSVRSVLIAKKAAKDVGVTMNINILDFGDILKWTSMHQKQVGILISIIATIAIAYALSYS